MESGIKTICLQSRQDSLEADIVFLDGNAAIYLIDLKNFEKLADRKLSKDRRVLGRQLEELQVAYHQLTEYSSSFREATEQLIDPSGPNSWVAITAITPYQLEINTSLPVDSPVEHPFLLTWLLAALFADRLLRRLHQRIQEARAVLFGPTPTFCGFSWQKRVWFLLHGSHPPKPEALLYTCRAFGCA